MSTTTSITPEDLLAHRAWLQRLALRLVDPATADDLVQDTWAAAVHSRPDRERPLRPWLAQVLRNLARMRARSRGRWRARESQLTAADDHPLPTPEELLTYHEAQRLVAQAVVELEEPYRSTVLLCYAQEIPPAEIARRQGIPAGTVRWRLKRGLDQLRAGLDARYNSDRGAWAALLAPLAARGAGTALVGGTAAAPLLAGTPGALGGKLLVGAAALSLVAASAWLLMNRSPADAPDDNGPALAERGAPPARPGLPRLLTAPPPGGPALPSGSPPGGAPPGATAALMAAPGPAPDREEALRRAAEPGDSPARGNPKAPVTIVTYTEFQCPFCVNVIPTLRDLQAAYPQEVRLVFKHLPLAFHESAGLAAEASMAAHEQGKFWEYHDRLFATPGQLLDPAALEQHAKALELDLPRWKKAFDSGKYRERVAAEVKLAEEAGIRGTPSFIINGEVMSGAQPLQAFKQRVQEALHKARGLPPPDAGAPRRPPPPQLAGAAPRPAVVFNPAWPPPPITLPESVLGDRVPQRFVTGDAPVQGNVKAPVEVLYFTELFCNECSRNRALLTGLLDVYGDEVKVVAKVISLGTAPSNSLPAEAALAAHAQGKFWEFHDALTAAPWHMSSDRRALLEQTADKAGLDLAEFKLALDDGRFQAALAEEREQVKAAGVGPSALLVNGRRAQSAVALVQLVETAIRKAGRRPPPRPVPATAVEIDPRSPAYDGPRLTSMYLTSRQLFAIEPRDDAWAPAIEKDLGGMLARDLKAVEPKLTGTSLDCRTSLCRLRWRVAAGTNPQPALAAVRFLYPVGDTARQDEPGTAYLSLRGGASRPGADALARLKSRRSSLIYTHRTGRAAQKAPFPIERLPPE